MIDKFAEIPMFIGKNIITGIFIAVALIILIRISFKGKVETRISLELIRWTIITYCIIALTSWLLLFLFPHSEEYAFIERATGPYAWAYWLMLMFNCLLPLILINKRIGKNIYMVFIIALLMNFGWLMENLTLQVVNFHRDYNEVSYSDFLLSQREIIILIKGLIVGMIALLIGNGIKKT